MNKLIVRFCFLLSLVLMSHISFAQYQPTWESLDQRPVPQWFKDSKFGIFIHWGVYAVPGYCTKGNYAEWYQHGLMNGDTARINFHQKNFGDRTYYDLANDFKAALFQPDEWAKLFEQSGAKYIVLTSKHHDGFSLWPDATANKTWGFPWNAKDIGPKRDLLGDLFTAVRKTSVRAGMYYSLYEWFNPLWKKDPKKYAAEHMWPQAQYLINTYQPDVFWTDGDWDASAETWKSKELLTWIYNESPVKENVVTYDRWGSGVRFKHGSVYTPEYQPDLDFEDHAWEESRGMGFSYGYNREEDAWDYNSTQSLVLQLIDKVSRGGNFLLDIGPDEHGKIPPIMQERLLQIGDWLKINGEAIYNTVRWKTTAQWTEGRKDYRSKSGDMLLKITIDPDPGYAVKEVFYTYNPTNNDLYALLPKFPDNKTIILKDMQLPAETVIRFLSTSEQLKWKQVGKDVEVEFPEYNPNKMKAPYAYAIKINGFGKFTTKPTIKATYANGSFQPTVSIESAADETVYYTLDGTEPTAHSALYSKPFVLNKTATVKAKAFSKGLIDGAVAEETITRYEWQKALAVANAKPGIAYNYFEPAGKIDLLAVNGTAAKSGIANTISEGVKQRNEKFALSFDGYVNVKQEGMYQFYTLSDDGSKLWINDREVVNNDGEHGSVEMGGKTLLKKGYHKIKVVYFDAGGGNELKVFWQPEGKTKELIPTAALFH